MSNEFSTPKLTPADNVKIPGVDGSNESGYLLTGEVKNYMIGNLYDNAPEYSTLETYTVGQRVKNEGNLYRCTAAVAVPEVFDPTKWEKIDLPSLDEGVLNAETDVAAVRGTTDGYQESGKEYAIGDPCIQDNIVYVAKEAIADPAGTFDPTKWDQSDLVTLMLKAKENSDAITSLNPTLVWINPSPTAEFSPQQIVPSRICSHYYIRYRLNTSYDLANISTIISDRTQLIIIDTGMDNLSIRNVSLESNGNISIGVCVKYSLISTSAGQDNTYCIPTDIYGWD